MTVNLKSGQHLHFLNTDFGTEFSASEEPGDNYIANGKANTGASTVAGGEPIYYALGTQAGQSWDLTTETNVQDLTMDDGFNATSHMQVMVQTAGGTTPRTNQILVDNDYPETSLTGIIANNLPYILIVVLALGGGAAYLAVKSRRRVTVTAAK